jgi:hypothetical protein
MKSMSESCYSYRNELEDSLIFERLPGSAPKVVLEKTWVEQTGGVSTTSILLLSIKHHCDCEAALHVPDNTRMQKAY